MSDIAAGGNGSGRFIILGFELDLLVATRLARIPNGSVGIQDPARGPSVVCCVASAPATDPAMLVLVLSS